LKILLKELKTPQESQKPYENQTVTGREKRNFPKQKELDEGGMGGKIKTNFQIG